MKMLKSKTWQHEITGSDTVVINGQEQEFAAGEFSNCVWGGIS